MLFRSDVLHPKSGEIIVRRDELMDERAAETVEAAGVPSMQIRSPLTCEAEDGICATCYGRDLARGTRVNTGEAVGIIAAQSIGEPGTQLTMRTFHIGGIAQGGSQSFQEANNEGKVSFRNVNMLVNADKEQIVMGRNMEMVIIDENDVERASYKLTYRSEEHTSELQSRRNLVCRLLLEKKKPVFSPLLPHPNALQTHNSHV